MIATIAWVLWGIVAVMALVFFIIYISGRDSGRHQFFGLPTLIWVVGLALTVIYPISKFHLLWIAPLGAISPFVIMQWRLRLVHKMSAEIIKQHLEEESDGEVWTFQEMRRLFEIYEATSPREFAETIRGGGFRLEGWWIAEEPGVGQVKVIRRADKVKGTLFFKESPRFYFDWSPDDAA